MITSRRHRLVVLIVTDDERVADAMEVQPTDPDEFVDDKDDAVGDARPERAQNGSFETVSVRFADDCQPNWPSIAAAPVAAAADAADAAAAVDVFWIETSLRPLVTSIVNGVVGLDDEPDVHKTGSHVTR